jgi:hypothetical protein
MNVETIDFTYGCTCTNFNFVRTDALGAHTIE